jgi:hydroxymethylglutaryl-CoA lyase
MLHRMGIATGIDLARAIDTARWIEQHVGHPVPGMLSKAGDFPRAGQVPG